jgi:hypothetical protein
MLVKFQEQVMHDIFEVISYRVRELGRKQQEDFDPNAETTRKMV